MMVFLHVVVVVFLVYAESNNRYQNFFHMFYTFVSQVGDIELLGGVQSHEPFHGALIFLHLGHSHASGIVLGQLHITGGTVLFQLYGIVFKLPHVVHLCG
jgi:hypothetical protein